MKPQLIIISIIFLLFSSVSMGQNAWQWAKGDTGPDIESWLATTDSAGNISTAGMSMYGTAVFGTYTITNPYTGCCPSQCIIAKYDGAGNVLWAKGVMTGYSEPMAIVNDPSGDLILLGVFSNHITIDTFNIYPTAAGSNYFLAKFDTGGHVIWAESLCRSPEYGSFYEDNKFISTGNIATDSNGMIYISAEYNVKTITIGSTVISNTDTSGLTYDIFNAKFDPNGNVLWAHGFGGDKNDQVLALTVSAAGNIYFAGAFASDSITAGSNVLINIYDTSNAFITELDPTGNPVWGMAGINRNGSYCSGIVSDPDNNLYISGSFGDTILSLDTTLIVRTYNSSIPLFETFLLKMLPDHSISWHKNIGAPYNGMDCYSLARCPGKGGSLWVAVAWDSIQLNGLIVDSANIAGHMIYTPDSSYDPVFIAGFDQLGNTLGSATLQSGGDDKAGVTCDKSGNVYLCSDWDGSEGFTYFLAGPDTLFFDTSAFATEMMFLAKYGAFAENITNVAQPDHITIYPNPSGKLLNIAGYNAPGGTIIITDVAGRIILEKELDNSVTTIDITALEEGLYFVTLKGNTQSYTGKFIKI